MKTRSNKSVFFKNVIKKYFFNIIINKPSAPKTPDQEELNPENEWSEEYVEVYRQATRWQTV